MLTYVIVTKDRHAELQHTLARLAALGARSHDAIGGAEVIVVDNASATPVVLPARFPDGIQLRTLRVEHNLGAAGRNFAAQHAQGDWLLMLDDDSSPLDTAFLDMLLRAPTDVAALAADIVLPSGRREAGGLPEVIVGCGAAVRTRAFLDVGGYDHTFHFYAEEYDLCAKLIAAGHHVRTEPTMRVEHRKVQSNRDMSAILRALVRNNGVIVHRYAPDAERDWLLEHTLERYRAIAEREDALAGYEHGRRELAERIEHEPRTAMDDAHWRRFTGEAAAAAGAARLADAGVRSAAVTARGKHDWAVERALAGAGVAVVETHQRPDVAVIGTLSPGPVLDALAEAEARLGPPTAALWSPRDGDRAAAPREATTPRTSVGRERVPA